MDKYKKLEKALLDLGYKKTNDGNDFNFMEGPCRLGFARAEANPATCHPAIIDKVCADSAELFDKYRNCLIQVPVPATEQERNILLYVLKLLGTPAGEELSIYAPAPLESYEDLHKFAEGVEWLNNRPPYCQ